MNWEELTDADFGKAVKDTDLCVLAIGVMERHADHLPLGTDMIVAQAVATEAARREPAVVFPPYYFGQIFEAKHFPGAVALEPRLQLELLEAVCDEIGRNGFTKILIYNGHGGNHHLIRYFAQCLLSKPKPYVLYHVDWLADWSRQKDVSAICPSEGGHADECETSLVMAVAPHLVKIKRAAYTAKPLGRMKHLNGINSGIWWYADFPEHYGGDGRLGSADKARKVMEIYVDALAKAMKKVKADKSVPALHKEFFERSAAVTTRKTRRPRRPGQ